MAWARCALENHARSRWLKIPVLLAITGLGPTIELWDPLSGRLTAELPTYHYQGMVGICTLPGYTGDGQPNGRMFLATIGDDMTIGIWNPVTKAPAGAPLMGHPDTIQDICSFPWHGDPAAAPCWPRWP